MELLAKKAIDSDRQSLMEHSGVSLEYQPVKRNVDSRNLVLEVSERNKDSLGNR